ncbi:hypothetical protein AAG906_021296 [Vitis piasezkii]
MGWTPIASHGLTLPLATFLPAHWIKEPFIVFRKCLGLLRSGYIPYARRVRASEESILLSSPLLSSLLLFLRHPLQLLWLWLNLSLIGLYKSFSCLLPYELSRDGIGHNSKMAAAIVLRHQF